MKGRVHIDNREIDIIQTEAEDFGYFSTGTRLSDAVSCFFCRLRNYCIQVLIAIGHEQNIPSHTRYLSAAIEIDLSALANFVAKIAVNNFFKQERLFRPATVRPHEENRGLAASATKNESSLASNGEPERTCEITMPL